MTTRTTQRLVAFRHPFALPTIDGRVAAGVYLIETDEELLDVISQLAWRRVSTVIHVHVNGITQVVAIDPAELDALLVRDEQATVDD
jgi:hypothetical protein